MSRWFTLGLKVKSKFEVKFKMRNLEKIVDCEHKVIILKFGNTAKEKMWQVKKAKNLLTAIARF